MLWPLLFAANLAQGIFLLAVFAVRKNPNPIATRLLGALLGLFLLSNLDDLLLATGWFRRAPWLFGYSMAAMFAYGPLLYLYIRVTVDGTFSWKRTTWLHFLPAAVNLCLNLPFLFLPAAVKTGIWEAFLAGDLPVRAANQVFFGAQVIHFFAYLWVTYRFLQHIQATPAPNSYQVPISSRISWLKILMALFWLFLFSLLGLGLLNWAAGHYIPGANYAFTLITTAIIYYIAYQLALRPELVTPDFGKKYQTAHRSEAGERDCLDRLNHLLKEEKIFTDADLKLGVLAARLQIPAHQLSRLINEQFGKSFSEVINQCRVEEFIARLDDPRYAHYTLYGLALEVGFNSKSAFNAAFKKLTGKNPSDFKQ